MAELLDEGNGRLKLSGRLTSEVVPVLEPQGRALLITAGAKYEIDLREVTFSSSAGVALMLAWLRAAQAVGAEVVFKNLPASMQGLLRVTELENILPLAE
ncbi:MAG: STAS domain-containing protein [Pseudomonadales bacterium]